MNILKLAWPVALAALVGCSGAFAQQARIGTFKSVEGEVLVRAAGGSRKAVSGESIADGHTVITGDAGAASLTLRDGTVIVVGNRTTMEMAGYSFNGTTQAGGMTINLLGGVMRFVTGLIGKVNPTGVKIQTATATVGIRGTDFIVEAQ